MSIYDSTRKAAHKVEQQSKALGLGSSGNSAAAVSRDAQRNAYLADMGMPMTTTPKRTPKTNTDWSQVAATPGIGASVSAAQAVESYQSKPKSSGYTPTYGTNALYTAPDNTGVKKTTGTIKTTGGLSTSSMHNNKMSDYDLSVRKTYEDAREKVMKLPYSQLWSEEEVAARLAYYQKQLQEEQIKKTAEQLREAERQQVLDEMTDLRTQAGPIAQRAQYESAHGSRQHNYFLQNQIADAQIELNRLNGAGLVMTSNEIKAEMEENEQKKRDAEAALQELYNISPDDLDRMSREEYLMGAWRNLNKALELNADVTGAIKGNRALGLIGPYQGLHLDYTNNGYVQANQIDSQLDMDINLAYNNYLNDPTEGNWEYVLYLEALQTQFKKNNDHLFGEDAPFSSMSEWFAHKWPEMVHDGKMSLQGKAVGALGSLATYSTIPVETAMNIGGEVSKNTSSHNIARGKMFRELIHAGVDKETAQKVADAERSMLTWTDSITSAAAIAGSKKLSKLLKKSHYLKEIVEWGGEELIQDLPQKLKESIHSLMVEQAINGEVNEGIWDTLEKACEKIVEEEMEKYHFLKGFELGD